MLFAIERASNTYLWELDCVYEGWDDEYFLEKTKEKPVDLPEIFKHNIKTENVSVDIWILSIQSLNLILELIEKSRKSIIIEKADNLLVKNGIDYIIIIYDDYVE